MTVKLILPENEAARIITETTISIMDGYSLQLGFEVPRLVVIPRSGLMVGDFVARNLGVQGISMLHMGIGRNSHGGFDLGQSPAEADVAGQNLLLLDGVCKSGETLQFAQRYLKHLGAASVRSAVMVNKPNQSTTGYEPDFVGETYTDGAFIVFPWERGEYMKPVQQPESSLSELIMAQVEETRRRSDV